MMDPSESSPVSQFQPCNFDLQFSMDAQDWKKDEDEMNHYLRDTACRCCIPDCNMATDHWLLLVDNMRPARWSV